MIQNIPITTANPNRLLTPKQEETLGYTALGKTCEEAASIMSCSPRTVKAHRIALFEKFNVHNQAQLIAQAFAKGYLKAGHTLLLLLAIFASTGVDEYRTQRYRSNSRKTTKTQRQNRRKEDSLDYLLNPNALLDALTNKEEWS